MNRIACFVGMSCSLVFLSGCAFTKTPVKIQLTPGATQPLTSEPKSALRVGEVKDERLKSDPRAVWQKANAYGKTSGAFVADKPVADFFREAIETALRTNKFNVVESGPGLELKAQIQALDVDSIQTGMFVSAVVTKLVVRFELFDTATGNSVWRDTLSGKSDDKTGWGGVSFVERNFKVAAEDVLRQIIADKAFRKFFE